MILGLKFRLYRLKRLIFHDKLLCSKWLDTSELSAKMRYNTAQN